MFYYTQQSPDHTLPAAQSVDKSSAGWGASPLGLSGFQRKEVENGTFAGRCDPGREIRPHTVGSRARDSPPLACRSQDQRRVSLRPQCARGWRIVFHLFASRRLSRWRLRAHGSRFPNQHYPIGCQRKGSPMRHLFVRFQLSASTGHVAEAVKESVAAFEIMIDHIARR